MILAPVVALALICGGQSSRVLGSWPAAMALHAKAKKVVAKSQSLSKSTSPDKVKIAPKTKSAGTPKSKAGARKVNPSGPRGVKLHLGDPYPFTPADITATGAQTDAWLGTLSASQEAIDDGQFSTAATSLQNWLQSNPADNGTVSLLADAYFRLNQNSNAYGLLAPFVEKWSDPDVLLRASLAAALMGEVYSGQRTYCVAYIRGTSDLLTDNANTLPQGNSPAALQALSCIALGISADWSDTNPIYYLQRALVLDSGNPVAAEHLGRVFLRRSRYTEAIAAFQSGQARAEGSLLADIKSGISSAQWLSTHGGD